MGRDGRGNDCQRADQGLVADLRAVVGRGQVTCAFGVLAEVGKKALDPLEHLGPIIHHRFSDDWQNNQEAKALEATLKSAISHLKGKFGEVSGNEADTRISNEKAALRYFNLDGSPRLPHIKPIDFDDGLGRQERLLLALVIEYDGRLLPPQFRITSNVFTDSKSAPLKLYHGSYPCN